MLGRMTDVRGQRWTSRACVQAKRNGDKGSKEAGSSAARAAGGKVKNLKVR